MKNHISPFLLDKYLQGHCTLQEEAQIRQWYDSFDNEDDYVLVLSELKKTEIRERIRNRIANNLRHTDYESYKTKGDNKHRMRYGIIMGIAALIVILFGVFKGYNPQTGKQQNIPAQSVITINNTRRIQQLILSDGSRVWLSPGARISYKKRFSDAHREVYLTGESFFEVTKDVRKPFIIYCNDITTKVWGTSFRVRDSYDQSFADVAVLTGKVSVTVTDPKAFAVKNRAIGDHRTEIMIYPNQQATFVKKDKSLNVQYKKEIKELSIWKKANLYFDNSRMQAVIPVLNHEFGVNLTVNDNLINEYELSADFNGLNFPQIMEILKKTLNISYDINEKTIMLKKSE